MLRYPPPLPASPRIARETILRTTAGSVWASSDHSPDEPRPSQSVASGSWIQTTRPGFSPRATPSGTFGTGIPIAITASSVGAASSHTIPTLIPRHSTPARSRACVKCRLARRNASVEAANAASQSTKLEASGNAILWQG